MTSLCFSYDKLVGDSKIGSPSNMFIVLNSGEDITKKLTTLVVFFCTSKYFYNNTFFFCLSYFTRKSLIKIRFLLLLDFKLFFPLGDSITCR